MSTDLQWLLLRGGNSFMVKRVPEGPVFSKEPGNLRNLHSRKYSGLANSKTIHIAHTGPHVQITTRKTTASPTAVKTAYNSNNIRRGSGSRRSAKAVAGISRNSYRPELRRAALARVSALIAAQKAPKPMPEKKTRAKKNKGKAKST